MASADRVARCASGPLAPPSSSPPPSAAAAPAPPPARASTAPLTIRYLRLMVIHDLLAFAAGPRFVPALHESDVRGRLRLLHERQLTPVRVRTGCSSML